MWGVQTTINLLFKLDEGPIDSFGSRWLLLVKRSDSGTTAKCLRMSAKPELSFQYIISCACNNAKQRKRHLEYSDCQTCQCQFMPSMRVPKRMPSQAIYFECTSLTEYMAAVAQITTLLLLIIVIFVGLMRKGQFPVRSMGRSSNVKNQDARRHL